MRTLTASVFASVALLCTGAPVVAADHDAYHDQIASYWMHAGDVKPFTGRMWSPWPFERRVENLADAGFEGIGIFHQSLQYVLENEAEGDTRKERLQWMADVLEANDMEYVELEFLTKWMLPKDDYRRQAEKETRSLLMDAAKALDADHIKVGNIFGYPVPTEQLKQRFAQLCQEGQKHGTTIAMEILPPDVNSDTLEEAMSWIGDDSQCGLFVDAWHVNHMEGYTYEAISNLDADDIVAAELNDGFTDIDSPYIGFIERTVNLRRIPGNGEFDLVGLINALGEAGFHGPWGNEILSEEYRRVPMDAAYPRVHRSTAKILKEAKQ